MVSWLLELHLYSAVCCPRVAQKQDCLNLNDERKCVVGWPQSQIPLIIIRVPCTDKMLQMARARLLPCVHLFKDRLRPIIHAQTDTHAFTYSIMYLITYLICMLCWSRTNCNYDEPITTSHVRSPEMYINAFIIIIKIYSLL